MEELREMCHSNSECRKYAYYCSDGDFCECAQGYRPDRSNKTCVGGKNYYFFFISYFHGRIFPSSYFDH